MSTPPVALAFTTLPCVWHGIKNFTCTNEPIMSCTLQFKKKIF